jgi:hypothetical protein
MHGLASVCCDFVSRYVVALWAMEDFSASLLSSRCIFLSVFSDGQSASLSWNKAPIWGLRPDFYFCQTVTGLLMRGTLSLSLSGERTGLSFTIVAGPRQCDYLRVRVPWDLGPYFTISDSRLPFSSPPTTRRVTVEVFDPASLFVPFVHVM